MSTLERAIEIAVKAHAGQTDKGGAPYITHPLRLMAAIPDGEAQIVAVLHDVVEDSDWTIDLLRDEGFSETVLSGVDSVTRREGEDDAELVKRAKADALGRIVKRADLLDNIARTRLKNRPDDAQQRIDRYQKALTLLDETDQLGG